MQIVIDISEVLKQKIDEGFTNQVIIGKLWDATKNGTLLTECDDAISREAAIEELYQWVIVGEYEYTNATEYLKKRIQKLPSVQPSQKEQEIKYWIDCYGHVTPIVQPSRRKGHWIWSDEINRYVCDKCGQSDGKDKEMVESGEYPLSNYCNNCGADMRGSENE